MKKFIFSISTLLLFILFIISCEKGSLVSLDSDITSSSGELIQATPQINRWEKLIDITNNKIKSYNDKEEKESKKFHNKFGYIDESLTIQYVRPNNSIYLIQPIRKKNKIKSLFVSFAMEGDDEYRAFVVDKQYLKKNEMNISGELYTNFEVFLDYFVGKEVINRNFWDGLYDGCYELTECTSCFYGGVQVQEISCPTGSNNGNGGDPYGSNDYPAFLLGDDLNDPSEGSGGPGPGSGGGPGGSGIGSIDALDMKNALKIAGNTFISQQNLNITTEELFSIIGFESYEIEYFSGFIDAIVNVEKATRRLVEEFFTPETPKGDFLILAEAFEDCFGTPDANGDFIDCSSSLATYSVTLYVDQPVSGTRKTFTDVGLNTDVGQTFASVNRNEGGNETRLVFGYYPINLPYPMTPEEDPSVWDNDGDHFDVSITYDLSCTEFNDFLQESISQSQTEYHLQDYNCTDFALSVFNNSAGAALPDTYGTWTIYGGSNLGDLGEDIRAMSNSSGVTVDKNGGNAPNSNCN